MKNKRLVFFIDTEAIGGAERYLVDLINGLRPHGYEMTVICNALANLPSFIKEQTSSACHVIALELPSITRHRIIQKGLALNRSTKGALGIFKFPGLLLIYLNILLCFMKLWFILKELSPDIFHISAGGYPASESNRAAVLAARYQHIPRRILTIHNQATSAVCHYPEKWIDQWIQVSVHLITTASEDARQSLITQRGFKGDKIQTIYCGIPTSTTYPMTAQELRSELHLPLNTKIIGTIGNLQPRKGHASLIRAFSLLAPENSDCLLAIIGSGPCETALRQQIHDATMDHQVFLLGYLKNAEKYLKAFDYFVFSSNGFECVPYVIKDAMLAGLPIVSTNVGGIREAIIHGQTGLLVAPESETGLADALKRLIKDTELSRTLGSCAQEQVKRLFSMHQMIEATENCYAS
jgi:glycosyltransferase involved in cell wall biosynthesis